VFHAPVPTHAVFILFLADSARDRVLMRPGAAGRLVRGPSAIRLGLLPRPPGVDRIVRAVFTCRSRAVHGSRDRGGFIDPLPHGLC
jgi:hypothetical protein